MLSLVFFGRHNVPDGFDTTKNNYESVISPPLRRNTIDDRTLFSPVTDEEFEQCLQILEMVSDSNGEVGMDEFILFLELYSGRELFFDDFQDLPTPYVLIFYAAACSVGGGCGDLEETLSLGQLEEAGAGGVLYMLCQSVKNVSAVQLSMNYQFQVRHVGEDNIYNVMSGLDGSSIIMALQDVSEKVLMEYFGCFDSSSRALLESRSGTRERREAILDYRNEVLHRNLEPADHSTLNIRASSNICDYRANAVIKTVTPSCKSIGKGLLDSASIHNLFDTDFMLFLQYVYPMPREETWYRPNAPWYRQRSL